jgi:hypothetical protein
MQMVRGGFALQGEVKKNRFTQRRKDAKEEWKKEFEMARSCLLLRSSFAHFFP